MTPPRTFRPELVALLGTPVAENPTGYMQEAAFAAAGADFRYVTAEVAPGDLPAAVAGVRAMGFRGANCTVPHKVAVVPLLDRLTPAAALIGAVNTIVREGDTLVGDNTDGKGFVRALTQHLGSPPAGLAVTVLGAGGAARAVAVELALAGAARIELVNRTPTRAEEVAAVVRAAVATLPGGTGAEVAVRPWDGPYRLPAGTDVLLNATSIGLAPDPSAPPVDLATLHAGLLVCDVVPNPPDTPFLRAAREQGAGTLDGLGMLVEQGAIAFTLWTGLPAPAGVMRDALLEVFAPAAT